MKLLLQLTLASVATLAATAHAHESEAASRPAEVHGVELASICTVCGVVSETHVWARAGKRSGVGAVGGAVLGGIVGHQIGAGSGNAVATALGVIGGGFAGNAIEKKARKETVWSTVVTFKDGSTETFEQTTDPDLDEGDVVKMEHGHLVKHAS